MKTPWKVTLFVALGILATVAFAEGGRQPPRDGCTFEAGRTVCATYTERVAMTDLGTSCSSASGILVSGTMVETFRSYTTKTYFGNSVVVESTVTLPEEQVHWYYDWVIIGTCERDS